MVGFHSLLVGFQYLRIIQGAAQLEWGLGHTIVVLITIRNPKE